MNGARLVTPNRAWAALVGAAGLVWALSAGAVKVADDCAECHETPAVSAEHEAVESLSVEACLECHEPEAGDEFIHAVHTSHLDEGFECVDCHGDEAPEREELDALLEGTEQ